MFKYLFKYEAAKENDFQKYYRPEERQAPNGQVEIVNRCMAPAFTDDATRSYYMRKHRRPDFSRGAEEDYQNGRNNFLMRLCELGVAVVLSVVIHTMSFENGGKTLKQQRNFDSPDFDYFNYFFRKVILGGEHPNLRLLLQRQDDVASILKLSKS